VLAWHEQLSCESVCLVFLASTGVSFGVANQVAKFVCCIEPAPCCVFFLRSKDYNWSPALKMTKSINSIGYEGSSSDKNAMRFHLAD